jgi:hypothetical protein
MAWETDHFAARLEATLATFQGIGMAGSDAVQTVVRGPILLRWTPIALMRAARNLQEALQAGLPYDVKTQVSPRASSKVCRPSWMYSWGLQYQEHGVFVRAAELSKASRSCWIF